MAIDTHTKRRSAMNIGTPVGRIQPLADGTIADEDRAHVAYMYSGLNYDGVVTPTDDGYPGLHLHLGFDCSL
jgi:hypothetical protein